MQSEISGEHQSAILPRKHRPISTKAERVAVAMSGGVDSSVAALLAHESGYDVFGVSMQVWDYRNNGGSCTRATCCAPSDFTDARRVAGTIGVPYYVFDFEKTFRAQVIQTFVDTYQRGETPNPCVDCNSKVKFRELRDRATALGVEYVATGHYARIQRSSTEWQLLRGIDTDKDQSYFLYSLLREELPSTLFPIGHLTKPEVRDLARRAGFVTAEKAESQDICFVSGSAADFVRQMGGKMPSGAIARSDGTVIGRHEGIHQFTVGQRRGLNIGGSDEPLYVTEIDPATHKVIIGPRSELRRESFKVGDLNWLCAESQQALSAGAKVRLIAQVRHRHKGVEVELAVNSPGYVTARFIDEWCTVSPGQAAVFYDLSNQRLIGGGRITPGLRTL